jgi:heme/copper-type cytochrome/quinol oxidase subunit 2
VKTQARSILPAAGLLLWAGASTAAACSTCFGKSDAPMAHGMNMGIMSLLVFIGLVLAGVVSFFVYVAKRTAALEARQALEDGSDDSSTDSH